MYFFLLFCLSNFLLVSLPPPHFIMLLRACLSQNIHLVTNVLSIPRWPPCVRECMLFRISTCIFPFLAITLRSFKGTPSPAIIFSKSILKFLFLFSEFLFVCSFYFQSAFAFHFFGVQKDILR